MVKLKLLCLALIIIFFGCENNDKNVANNQIFQKAQKSDSLAFYFPSVLNDTFVRKNPSRRNFTQNWYSSALYSFKEPILYKKDDSEIIYRFLWLRSFHQPVCFSLKMFNDSYYLNTKILDRQPAFYPEIIGDIVNGKEVLDTVQKADRFAKIISDKIIQIKKDEWDLFENYLKENNFWDLHIIDTTPRPSDGAQWILEGYKNKKYHFI